ncbi:MAG: Rpn family recombination-promoting nuclease/putative transposase [Prevotellaceae bacterium]|jgi:predicted transposase/invertase (TIGR01784 family)|nr:Rpn family recombination-promoting nuclease/putative transposase [Prevotellaceae bacterium]
MSDFLTPFTDWSFKFFFGREQSKEILIPFLNDLLPEEDAIVDLHFLDREQQPEARENRLCIFDIYCQTDTGKHFIVEMQRQSQVDFKDRAFFYISTAVTRQGKSGNDWNYNGIAPVYGVFFLDFHLSGINKPITDVVLADRETGEVFYHKIRQVFISLPDFKLTADECNTKFEQWIYSLKNMETLGHIPEQFKRNIPALNRLEELARVGALSSKEYDQYQESLKVHRDNLAVLTFTHLEGRKEGRQEGRKEGLLEGKMDDARNLKRLGVATEIIMQGTGLSREVIERL